MVSDINLTLEYINVEVEKSDLDQPLVKLNYRLKTGFNNRTTDLYLYIESITYKVTLQSSDSNSSTFATEMRIGEFYSPNRIFVQIGMHSDVFFYFILPTKALGLV